MTPAKKKPATDWAEAFSKPETAPKPEPAKPAAPAHKKTNAPAAKKTAQAAAAKAPAKKSTPEAESTPSARRARVSAAKRTYNVGRPVKKAATYRLPLDVLELIQQAIQEAADNGDRLTRDDAVTQAIRYYYTRRRRH